MLDRKYILIWLLFLMLASPLKATEIDSLRAILEKENSLSAKCAVLDEISFLFVDSTAEIATLDSALHEILHSRDTAMIYEAISSMGRFYYNNNRQEALYDLMSRTEAASGAKGGKGVSETIIRSGSFSSSRRKAQLSRLSKQKGCQTTGQFPSSMLNGVSFSSGGKTTADG